MVKEILTTHLNQVEQMLSDLQDISVYQIAASYKRWYAVAYDQVLNNETLLDILGEAKYSEMYEKYWKHLDPDIMEASEVSRFLSYAQLALEFILDEVQKANHEDLLSIEGFSALDSALSLYLNDLDEMLNESIPPQQKAAEYIDWYDRVSEQLLGFGVLDRDTGTSYAQLWNNAAPTTFPGDYSSTSSINSLIRSAKSALLAICESNSEVALVVGGLFPLSIVSKAKGFVQSVALQANGCYEKGWYDASAVMLRRLIEILIVDCFDVYDALDRIKDSEGNIFGLRKLVEEFVDKSDDLWHIERGVGMVIKKLKGVGDDAAHGRYKKTLRQSLDRHKADLAIALQQIVAIIERGMFST